MLAKIWWLSEMRTVMSPNVLALLESSGHLYSMVNRPNWSGKFFFDCFVREGQKTIEGRHYVDHF